MDTPQTEPQPAKVPLKRKEILIIAAVIIVVILIAVISAGILISQRQNIANNTNTNNTEELDNQDANSVTEPVSNPKNEIKEEEQTTNTVVLGELTINFSNPEVVGTEIFYNINTQSVNYNPEYNTQPTYFMVYRSGTVTSGSLIYQGQTINLAYYPYYVAFDIQNLNGYSGAGWEHDHYLRYIQLNNQSDRIILDGWIGVDREYSVYLPAFTYLVADNIVEYRQQHREFYKGTYEDGYKLGSIRGYPFSELDGSLVDTAGELDIYIDNSDSRIMYTPTEDGFVYGINYYPYLINPTNSDSFQPVPQVIWNDGTTNTAEYDYISIGGCAFGITGLEVISGDDMLNLTAAGQDSAGRNIYEYQNGQNDYLEKLYSQDYIERQYYKHNADSNDDSQPYSFEQFIAKHPLFLWEDNFGRVIRFAHRQYVYTGGCAKPIVYLYPETPTQVNVQVIPNGNLTFTYPKYQNGWNVIAFPNGELKVNSKSYDYLWWESQKNGELSLPNSGFVVDKNTLQSFFENKLSHIGLNQKEISDFTEYWVSEMQKEAGSKFLVRFLINDEVNQIAKLEFDTEIDTLIRVFMVYTPVNENAKIQEQQLPSFKREGFTVVEWGGAKE